MLTKVKYALLTLVVLQLVFVLGVMVERHLTHPGHEACFVGVAGIRTEYDMVVVGDATFCGHLSSIVGPSKLMSE